MTIRAPGDAIREACRTIVEAAERTQLSTRFTDQRREPLMLADGYLPLLVDYTAEDREAKGLRKLRGDAGPRIAVHETVLESIDRERLLFLTGPAGSGKHTSLLHLAAHLAGSSIDDRRWTLETLARPVPRNAAGTVLTERWGGLPPVPLFLAAAETIETIETSLRLHGAVGARVLDGAFDALLLVDRAERLGDRGPDWLVEAAALAARLPRVRIVFAGETDVCDTWRVPGTFARRRVMPLFAAQRDALHALIRPQSTTRRGAAQGTIALQTLACEVDTDEAPTTIVDRWLAEAARRRATDVDTLVASTPRDDDLARLDLPFLFHHVEARRLESQTDDAVAALYRADLSRWSAIIRVLAQRLVADGRPLDGLLTALMQGDGDASARGAVDAVRIAANAPGASIEDATRDAIRAALVPIVEQGRLPIRLRDEAGRALATHGDLRDLDALVAIAAGPFTMGSTAHPNSAPPHVVTLAAYRIGRYPVTNDRYRRFVTATGRAWHSTDGLAAQRSNSPAVDLSWRDARAYCDWLTGRWRDARRIATDEIVRLPTEPEWERAARGSQVDAGLVWPYGGTWHDDRANAEEAGLNDTCTVGLFPAGRAADGCDDLAGQVWEWTTTLWGEDMATPRFAYPYAADDGREDPDAPADVRRVLRGACFLSPREKANCVYRGSLEPDGTWRGNGFRIVVAYG